MASGERIDGWKAIGAYFGRDRTTAMRWAKDRGLPVRRLPGGKTATVYALMSELERWALGHQDDLAAPISPSPGISRDRAKPELPADPNLAQLYIQARDDWALRTPPALNRAIAALGTVTREDTNFAPAYSALADAYLLAREFGSLADPLAFELARASAHSSLRLDAGLAAAHRAIGFIAYWWDNDPEAATWSFRRALDLQPDSAQTHFWFGNVLSDNGQSRAAIQTLNRARLLEPGSVAIRMDLAWAEWEAGQDDGQIDAMRDLINQSPEHVGARQYLAIMLLGEGDAQAYVAAFDDYAHLRNQPEVAAQAARMRDALAHSPAALETELYRNALETTLDSISRNHAWAAFVASALGNRSDVMDALERADARQETWGSAGLVLRMRRSWAGDADVIAGLTRRSRPPVI